MTNLIRRFLVALLLLSGPLGAVSFAQTFTQESPASPDYEAWEKVANQAAIALTQKRASSAALEELRASLVTWRSQFLVATTTGSDRIKTLKSQIEALGPLPEDGQSEPTEVTARRISLSKELDNLIAPRLVAEEAHSHADGLIREIDSIIRTRDTERLFENQGSPLTPSRWPTAIIALSKTVNLVASETSRELENNRETFLPVRDLPTTIFFLAVAIVLLLRGRAWMVRLTGFVQGDMGNARSGFRGFLVSLGQLALPIIGVLALIQAFSTAGVLGFRGQIIANSLIPIGFAFFIARWLALRVLPQERKRQGLLQVSDEQAGPMRRYMVSLALIWAVNQLLTSIGSYEAYSEATLGVLQFPLILIGGIILVRIGQVLRVSVGDTGVEGSEEWTFRSGSVGWFAGGMMVVGVLGPLATATGYVTAGALLVFSSILTIGLFSLVIILAGVLRDLYALLSRKDDEDARQSLIPILVSFALVLLSLPVLALIWGSRFSDLTEMWARFQKGVSLGDVRISPGAFLTFAIVFAIGFLATRLVQSTLRTSVLPKTKIDSGGQSAIISGLGYVGLFLAALVAISTAGIDLSSLAIVAGALSVGIGFGLQNIVSNFVSGIILLVERPITEGDWIAVSGYEGTVRNISVRSTRIETFNRSDVIIPNSDLVSGAVTNYTRSNSVGRVVLTIGVAYGSDTRRVQQILSEASVVHPLVYDDPPPSVNMDGFGADSINFKIRAVLRDVNYILTVKSEILHEINRRFIEEGIEIPFAQRDVWLRNPETLPGSAKPARQAKTK